MRSLCCALNAETARPRRNAAKSSGKEVMIGPETATRTGALCGGAKFSTRDEPLRTGLCHCMTGRKAHAFRVYAFPKFVVAR